MLHTGECLFRYALDPDESACPTSGKNINIKFKSKYRVHSVYQLGDAYRSYQVVPSYSSYIVVYLVKRKEHLNILS